MQIRWTSVFVDDQDKALQFYTEILGFVKKQDIRAGEARWITLVSPDAPDGIELVLEPNNNPAVQIHGQPAAAVFQKALYEAGVPFTAFFVEDVQREFERLKERGVVFTVVPTKTEWGVYAIFDDTCGNLMMLNQVNP